MRTEASLGKRYIVKLMSNMASVPLYLAMEAILPRALGPAVYGNFSFSTHLFQQVAGFLDMGSSNFFYTSLSRRPTEFGLPAFYSRIAGIVLVICLLGGLAMQVPLVGAVAMPGVPAYMGLWASVLAYMFWFTHISRSMNDALGQTTTSELVRISVNIVAMLVLLGLYATGVLNLVTLFCHQYALYIATAAGYFWCLRKAWPGFTLRLGREQNRAYIKEFSTFSLPLFWLALASIVFLFGERWLLQFFGGSAAQGYFTLSQKVGMACFFFVTAMTPLIMREFSLAHAEDDVQRMAGLVDKHGPMLYALSGYFSCFAAVEAETVVRLLGGEEFTAAILPVRIMALCPMHQAYGQLLGSLFYARGHTTIMRNNSVAALATGLIVSWFLLAPSSLYGLNLGALGLAIKMATVPCLFVNILLFIASRHIPLKFWSNVAHQLLCPCLLLLLAFAGGELAAALGVTGTARVFASMGIYSLCCMILFYSLPWLGGMTRREVRGFFARKTRQSGQGV
jgi:O-antigen/teichoic acid export membrane protein